MNKRYYHSDKPKDTLTLPRPLLDTDARTLWVYVNLLAIADENGNIAIRVNSWCGEIGLTRQQLRQTINGLVATNYITNSATNCGANGKTNLTICRKTNFGVTPPTKKTIPRPTKQSIKQPIITHKTSSKSLMFVGPMFEEAFTAWLDYKKQQFKFEYKTERSLKAAYTELVRLSNNNPETAMQIVEQSMSNGWKGLFELKNHGTSANPPDTPASRKARRDRGLSLADKIVSESEALYNLFNGEGENPDAGKD